MRLDKCPGRLVTCYYYYGLSIALLLIILSLLQSAECYSSQPSQKVTTHRRYSSDKQSSYFQNPLCNSVKCKSTNNIASTKLKSPKTTSKLSFPGLVTSTPRSSSLLAIHDIHELKDLMKKKRKKCKGVNYKGFECQKVKWYMWLVNEFDNNVTEVTPWIELLRNEDLSDLAVSQSELVGLPETWYDKLLHKLVTKWGGPIDQFMFQKYKEYVTSRELKLKVPIIGEVKMSPRVHSVAVTGRSTPRWFWDPGFNLKLKLPFFKDELKVAISTGPSFLAGIGTGIALLILKSIFAPFLFGLKYMIYNFFWKEGSPWDMMKSIWGGGGWGPEPWESNAPPPAIEHYEPPHVHNHYDNGKEQYGSTGGSGFGFGYNGGGGGGGGGFDQKLQFSQLNPILQGLTGPSSNSYKSSSIEEGRHRQHFKGLLTGPSDDSGYGITGGGSIVSESQDHHDINKGESGFNYVPSNGLQAEVENYDPFYSPLLSRIDSIFTHLGYHDEGCRERAVCSIYKFPVKYAPYSNLLSAQLSKHQSELKRPVTSSPKVLRYFKYMKAAKDGQGAANCIEMYPKCTNDTDSVSNLPMITTFNQLTELMGPEVSGPSG